MTTDQSLPPDGELSELEQHRLRALLEDALDRERVETVDVLPGVQEKIRQRSQGKFFDDGWSTVRHPPVSTYLITSLFMLAFVLLTFFVLYPFRGSPEPVRVDPPPVEVVAPLIRPAPVTPPSALPHR
jgi:hypothetical protein